MGSHAPLCSDSFLYLSKSLPVHIYMLLLLSHFSRVQLCTTHRQQPTRLPPSLGFSRQEHWSGLPFPSPMHESESKVTQSCPIFSNPWTTAYQAPPSMEFSRQESTGVGCHCLLLIFMYLCDNTADVFLPNMTERFMRKRVRSIFPTNVYSSTQFSRYLECNKCAKHFYEKK